MEIIHFTTLAIQAIEKYQQTLQIPANNFLRVGIRQKNETNKRLLIGFDEKTDLLRESDVFFYAIDSKKTGDMVSLTIKRNKNIMQIKIPIQEWFPTEITFQAKAVKL